jgi:hypothetical protein
VVSTHRHAINLGLPDGSVVALLARDLPLHPWALGLEIGRLDDLGLSEDMIANPIAGTVRLGPVVIRFDTARVVELYLRRRLPTDLRIPQLVMRQLVTNHAESRFSSAIDAALDAWQTLASLRRAYALVGIGEGFTPEGDDTLVGILAALDLVREISSSAQEVRRDLVDSLDRQLDAGTPRASAQMVRAAAAGRYAEPVLDLLDAIARAAEGTERASDLSPEADALLALGHTSGAATLRGIRAVLERLGQSESSRP